MHDNAREHEPGAIQQSPGMPRRSIGSRRSTATRMPADWQSWLLSATVRAGIASGFLLTPTVRVQLGGAAVAAICLFIGMLVVAALIGHWYISHRPVRRDLAADALAVIALAPSVIVTAGIQGAEDRFGGRTINVLAALGSSVIIFAIVAIIARLDDRIEFGAAALGALGGALTLVAMLGNPDLYSTQDAWQALSIAWMVAAATSLIFGLLSGMGRSILPFGVYAAFSLVLIMWPGSGSVSNGGADTLSILTLIVAGATMALIAPAESRS